MNASLFAMVLGLLGLGNSWRLAAQWWGYPPWVAELLHAAAIVAWLLLVCLYALKWFKTPQAARAEARHGVQGNFVALVPISTMLIALAVWPMSQAVATCVFLPGLASWLLFALWQGGRLFTEGGATAGITHALYIPWVAGNFAAAMASNAMGWTGWDQLFFGAGLLSWLALESVVLQRMLVAPPLPAALRATVGIQLAPPAVGLLAYLAVTPEPAALVVHMLLGYAVLQALMLLRLAPWMCQQGWSMAYWSVSFGATGLAVGAQRWSAHGGAQSLLALVPILFWLSNGVVGLLLAGSALGAIRGPTRLRAGESTPSAMDASRAKN